MGKVGQYLGEHAARNAVRTLAAIVRVNPVVVLLMEGAFSLSAMIPDHIMQIGRPTSLMTGFVLPQGLDDCYQAGCVMAGRVISMYGHLAAITHWMLENEPPASEAERWGAFDAGAADTFGSLGRIYVAGNWSYGVPEAPDFVIYWRTLQSMRLADYPMVLGYHGYTKGNPNGARYLERRPWTMWKPALEAAGLSLPSAIIMTEAGYDRETYPNGYRHNWTSEQYSDYLQKLPELVPEALGFVVFGYGMTDDWGEEQKGFDIEGDATVLAGMAAAKGEELMPVNPMVEDWLTDMWRRSGVEPNKVNDAMWEYCLDLAKRGSRAIVPQPSPDGNYQNHSHDRYVVGYTMPVPLYMDRSDWVVHEGFPPLV